MSQKTINIKQLDIILKDLAKDINKSYKQSLIKYVKDIENYMWEISPVDSGLYRSSHLVSLNERNYQSNFENKNVVSFFQRYNEHYNVLNNLDPNNDNTIYIQNNLPYAEKLENGWSGQAPSGVYIIAITAKKFKFTIK